MEHTEEILEIVREIREDVSYMKRHRNMLCGMPVLEVDEVCDLLKMSDRQLRRYRTSGQLTGFRFGCTILSMFGNACRSCSPKGFAPFATFHSVSAKRCRCRKNRCQGVR